MCRHYELTFCGYVGFPTASTFMGRSSNAASTLMGTGQLVVLSSNAASTLMGAMVRRERSRPLTRYHRRGVESAMSVNLGRALVSG